MKAPLNLNTATQKFAFIVAFLPIAFLVYPETMSAAYNAQNSSEKALVFEVSSKQNLQNNSDLTNSDEILVAKVREYLESKGSPLAEYADDIVQQPQWQRALAISFVESNFGKYCANNNCSGIGVSPSHPSWRKYPTKLDWFKDMTQLLEKPIYKERYTTCAKMKGVYVVPGSPRWVNGCNSVINELVDITQKAQEQKIAQLQEIEKSYPTIATIAMNWMQ